METIESLPEIAAFVAVVEEKSFTDAAERLRTSKGYISRQVNQLEERLGAPLLVRTTRSMRLTDVGAAFYERSRAALAEIDDARRAVAESSASPRGPLRITLPMSFGRRYLAPLLPEFSRQYSDVSLDVVLDDRIVDVVAEGFDLAVRIGELPDSTLVTRKLAASRRIVCASPGYLRRRGTPKHPRELSDHECMHYEYPSAGNSWVFESRKDTVSVAVSGAFRSNEGDVLSTLACGDQGVVLLPEFVVSEALSSGALRHILPNWWAQESPIYAVYPQNRHLLPRVRVLIDFLVVQCAGLGGGAAQRGRGKQVRR